MSLFVRSKFASNLLTHNRRGSFTRERRRNIKIFQAFIVWKAPSIMRYRRVQFGLMAAIIFALNSYNLIKSRFHFATSFFLNYITVNCKTQQQFTNCKSSYLLALHYTINHCPIYFPTQTEFFCYLFFEVFLQKEKPYRFCSIWLFVI